MKSLSKRFKVLSVILTVFLTFFACCCFYLQIGGYGKYLNVVKKEAEKRGVSIELALAIIKTESNFNPRAVSNKGAVGIMQIMPQTAKFMAIRENIIDYDLFDADTNILLGISYLNYLSQKFDDEYLVICAYNAGETNVKKWLNEGKITKNELPFKETENYLKRVLLRKSVYKILI